MYHDFIVDHQFLFALKSNSTGLNYFTGRVLTLDEDITEHDEL